jgi:hypothetical protein
MEIIKTELKITNENVINFLKTKKTLEVCGKKIVEVEIPERAPDLVSKSGSEYWYGEDDLGRYKIRKSPHWGTLRTSDYIGTISASKIHPLPIGTILNHSLVSIRYSKTNHGKLYLDKNYSFFFDHEIKCFFNKTKKDAKKTIDFFTSLEFLNKYCITGGREKFAVKYYA